jgi:hypothetical protein
MVKQASLSMAGWIRFLEILESEGFLSIGAVLLLPGNGDKELSKSFVSQLHWMWTLRNCLAHNWFLINDDRTFSNLDILEYFTLERIELLYKQINSSLERKDFIRLTNKITELSSRWGVAVTPSCLDIAFIGDELVSHPFVRYLNLRNNIIFDKIEVFNTSIQSGLFNQSSILDLSSYSQEEFIPSLNVTTFFTDDLNSVKHKIKTSILSRSINKLIKSEISQDTEGGKTSSNN